MKKVPNRDAREAAAFARLAALDSPERPILALFAAAVVARDVELAEAILDTWESRILRKKQEANR